jgi:hypothetical protein
MLAFGLGRYVRVKGIDCPVKVTGFIERKTQGIKTQTVQVKLPDGSYKEYPENQVVMLVKHISEIPQPRTASRIIESLPEGIDWYHDNILRASKALKADGRAAHKYITQYSSGTTIWRFGDSSVSVLVDGKIEED